MRSLNSLTAIQGRTRVLLYLITGILGLCAVSYWFFQVVRKPYFLELAEQNQYKEGRIAAPRGKIVDRSGEVILVDNSPAFNLYIIPERCENINLALIELGEIPEGFDEEETEIIEETEGE